MTGVVVARSYNDIKLGIIRLQRRLEEVRSFDPNLVQSQSGDPNLAKLRASVDDAIVRTFGMNASEHRRYADASAFSTGPVRINGRLSLGEIREAVGKSRERSIALLEQAILSLEEQDEEYSVSTKDSTAVGDNAYARKVFLVHGHDTGVLETVARFLERLSFEVVILNEQANRGLTVIEKIEAQRDIGFSVVLLTPDDEGKAKGEKDLNPRARQNVMLELGYFIGLLGRNRVCALKKQSVEVPSDFAGVVWTNFDQSGAWKQLLAKELDAAGYGVDWNIVMKGG